MDEPLVFTGHEDLCADIEAALQPFGDQGCHIRRRPWNKGLYRVAVRVPDPGAELREAIGAEAYRASVNFYEERRP